MPRVPEEVRDKGARSQFGLLAGDGSSVIGKSQGIVYFSAEAGNGCINLHRFPHPKHGRYGTITASASSRDEHQLITWLLSATVVPWLSLWQRT